MSMESTQRIEDEAGRWLARRDSGNWSAADEQDFERWMSESMAHSVAYWRLQSAWEGALRLKALGAGSPSEDPPPPGQWNLSPFFAQRARGSDSKRLAFGRRAGVLAASVALAAVTWAAVHLWQSANSFTTPVGGVASLPIADGSKVTLNTDSRIKVAISETERRIDLTYGEAFFEVAKDAKRPFVVFAGDKRVIAVGTSFSVRRGMGNAGDDIEVVVTEGVVKIVSAGAPDSKQSAAQSLPAGSIARTSGTELIVQHKETREAEQELSWRSGMLVLKNVTLAAAAAEFNRYNQRKILIEDASVASLSVAGNFRSTGVESFVDIVEKGYPVRVSQRNGDFLVSAER
ncbi:FecR family protein [Steroidobacter sp.]|uniref:FecR family protein n=1 Tax=Steroidobacter sp. TaxID=1978227 RepID=UPI001A4EB4EE|nr:FecR domain-containing protein [Steroidobacter sp.]MBL8266805.1 FecR domain-containing protein [Steroidobacter sp.]